MSLNPYPGLRPFEYKEYELFFGREGQADEVLRRLQKSHFVAVVGTSGSGKSSLVRAGLLPLLYSGLLYSAGANWRVAILRPGNTPIQNLANALVYPPDFAPQLAEKETNPLDINDEMKVGVVETILRRSSVGLIDYVKGNNLKANENLLVVVDQFEELFRYEEHIAVDAEQQVTEAEDKAAFVKLLLNAVHDQNIRNVYIVITMRSDYLGDCAQFRDLPETINDGQYLIPRMTRDQLREAIEEPARTVRDAPKLSELLVNRLLNDIGDNQDQLPILQHALMQTWKEWAAGGKPPEITVEHYERVGGMAKALSLHADKAFNELSAEQQIIAEKMFRCLTHIDAGNRETRRETELGEICRIIDAEIPEMLPVIEAFRHEGRTFLMPPPEVSLIPESIIDISHESLIRNWEKLKKWVAEEAEWANLYRRLANDALLHLNEEVTYWRDPALQIALNWRAKANPNAAWAERYHPAFDEAMQFLDESEAERAAQIAKDKAQVKRLRLMIGALAFMLLISFGMLLYSFALSRQARASELKAIESQKLAVESENAALKAKETIDSQNEKLTQSVEDLEKEKAKADKANLQLTEKQTELEDALKKAEDSAKEQARLADEAEKARNEALQNAETARKAEEDAKAKQIIAENATLAARNAEDETNKTLKREGKSRAASMMVERGLYRRAAQLFNEVADEYKNSELPDKETGQWWMLHNLGEAQWKNNNLDEAHKTYLNALKLLGERIDDPNVMVATQTKPEQSKSVFIKTAFQSPDGSDEEKKLNKIATYRKLGQLNRERALSGFGDDMAYYRWAKLGYENFFALYKQSDLAAKGSPIVNEVSTELGDVYLALDEFDKAKEQFTLVLNDYKSTLKKKSEEFTDGRVGVEMWIKLSEAELKQEKYEAASLQIKEGIDTLEAKDYANDPLVAELYEARAKIYTQRSRKAQKAAAEIDEKVKLLDSEEDKTEIDIKKDKAEIPAQKVEQDRNKKEQEKFSKLAANYSAVATGIRNLNLPENQSLKIDDFEPLPYENLSDAYLKVNKCINRSEIVVEALSRIKNIASSNAQIDPAFLIGQTFRVATYLSNGTPEDKKKAGEIYLDMVNEATDENVLLAFKNPEKFFYLRSSPNAYHRAGLMLRKSDPDAAIKYFKAYLFISENIARQNYSRLANIIFAYDIIADILLAQGKLPEAEAAYQEGFNFINNYKFENLPGNSPFKENTLREFYIASLKLAEADFYKKANQKSRAKELYKTAAEVFERQPYYSSYQDNIYALKNLADIEKEDKNTAEALRLFEQIVTKLNELNGLPKENLEGRYMTGLKKSAYYLWDYASVLNSLVEIKGTGDIALVKKRDDAVKAQPKFKILDAYESGWFKSKSCKEEIDPEFEENPKED